MRNFIHGYVYNSHIVATSIDVSDMFLDFPHHTSVTCITTTVSSTGTSTSQIRTTHLGVHSQQHTYALDEVYMPAAALRGVHQTVCVCVFMHANDDRVRKRSTLHACKVVVRSVCMHVKS